MFEKEKGLFDAFVAKKMSRRELINGAGKLGLSASAAGMFLTQAQTRAMAADFDWQKYTAFEVAVAPLDTVHILFGLGLFLLLLTADRQNISLHAHLDVILVQARKLDYGSYIAVAFLHIHGRTPVALVGFTCRRHPTVKVVEKAVHLISETQHAPHRSPSD